MEDFDKIKDQMKPLLSLVKDTENTDIEVDIYYLPPDIFIQGNRKRLQKSLHDVLM